MCVSSAQKNALGNDQAFGQTLRDSYNTDFSESQQIFDNLNGNLGSIIAAGPSQQGMSAEQLATQNSQAINNAAAANKQVQQAIGENAAKGGASPGVESGIEQAERAQAATQVENNMSNQEANITNENYNLGRQQYNNAVSEEEALPAATMNPVSNAASAVNSANNITDEQANENQAASTSWMGLLGGLASKASATFGVGSTKVTI